MQDEFMFAGFGGQGILLTGKILAHAAMLEGTYVSWIPSYGPEMRGGTAYCTVVISNEPIGSPIIRNPQYLVAMNRPSFEKFAPLVKPNGVILINTSLITIGSGRNDVKEIAVPVIDIAKELGNVKVANVVALGALVKHSQIVSFKILKECIKMEFALKPALIPLNIEALEAGGHVKQQN
jgi:2-oxoglutarate ferredoxin oxidoreductase subunit gamma